MKHEIVNSLQSQKPTFDLFVMLPNKSILNNFVFRIIAEKSKLQYFFFYLFQVLKLISSIKKHIDIHLQIFTVQIFRDANKPVWISGMRRWYNFSSNYSLNLCSYLNILVMDSGMRRIYFLKGFYLKFPDGYVRLWLAAGNM